MRRSETAKISVGAVKFWWDVTDLPPGPQQEARKASDGPRLRELVCSIDPKTRAAQIPPKALCLIHGGHDEHVALEMENRLCQNSMLMVALKPGGSSWPGPVSWRALRWQEPWT